MTIRSGAISAKEFVALAELISQDNSLYQALWRCAYFVWDESIGTAAVGYDKRTGQIGILLAPSFWDSLNEIGKKFVLYHEASHIFYNHLTYAGKSVKTKIDPTQANVAQDVAINHIIEDYYIGNARENMPITLCFIDTVFSEEEVLDAKLVPHLRWTVYYDVLMKRPKAQRNSESAQTVDKHVGDGQAFGENQDYVGFEDLPEDLKQEVQQQVQQEIESSAGASDIEQAESAFNKAGIGEGGSFLNISRDANIIKSRRWEEVIQNILASMVQKKTVERPSWATRSRNSFSLAKDIILPGTVDMEYPDPKRKYKALFFLDASGSCVSYASRFFNLVRTVPEEMFEVSLCSFDTRVYELELSATRVKGGGGTYFHIMERHIQAKCKEQGSAYPDVVFVLTDGMGDKLTCQYPKRWVWLLTHNYTSCIPEDSKKIMLNKFI